MQTLTVSLATLRAARTHSADGDIRAYLNGVYLDTVAGKVVATDGHRLLAADAAGIRCDAPPVIVSNSTIDAALKQYTGDYARGKRLGDCDVTITVDGQSVTIATPTGQVTALALDGRFPEWRRVVPSADTVGDNVPAVLNYQYLFDACDAVLTARNLSKKAASNNPVRIHYRGDSPAVVTDGRGGLVVIVMPVRNEIRPDAAVDACRDAHTDTPPAMPEVAEAA
jgi:DNA polymerase III sliding clamp (beta) subunit (PCNA family)